jgi:hypothetical protein
MRPSGGMTPAADEVTTASPVGLAALSGSTWG